MSRPDLSRVPNWYHGYIEETKGDDLLALMEEQLGSFLAFTREIPADKYDHRYAEGKWSIKDLLQHIIDAERIIAYRALRFARKDSTPLPGFEENDYAVSAKAERRSWSDLVEEFKQLRNSNLLMFRAFDSEELEREGIANGQPVYVLALGYIMVGHIDHHLKIIRERYL
jgi:hypothetical protein